MILIVHKRFTPVPAADGAPQPCGKPLARTWTADSKDPRFLQGYRHTVGIKAKGFYVEGFVRSSDIKVSDDGDTIVIQAAEVHCAPEGTRSRVTILRENKDKFMAIFELAMPGSDYEEIEELTMVRVE
jgi:hypothetical protein